MDAAISPPDRFAKLGQRGLFVALAVLFGIVAARYGDKVSDGDRSAFLRWRDQILDLRDGANIWDRYNYPNPPIMAMILVPLASLPPLVGSMTWFALKVVMALTAIHLVFRLVQDPGKPWPLWAKAVAIALSLRPIMGDLTHGNVNLFILLLCVAALSCYRKHRDLSAGGLLALAIACKVTPLLFLPYFAWKRSWKLLGGAALGLVLFCWLVPGLVFGFERNQDFLADWYAGMVKPYVEDGVVTTEHQNQSLPGLAHRLLTNSASFSEYDGDGYVPVESHAFVDWDPRIAAGLVKGLMALFAVVALAVCRTPTADRRSWRLAAEYALVFLGMLLFSERTWKHHCVTLLVPFAVLAYYLALESGRTRKRWVIALLVVASLLMISTSTGGSQAMVRLGKLAQVYGAYIWANLLLATGLVIALRRRRTPVETVKVIHRRVTVWTTAPERTTEPARAKPQAATSGE